MPFEQPGTRVAALAQASGAVGVGYDEDSLELIVRVRSIDNASGLRLGALRDVGAPARVAQSRWTPQAVNTAMRTIAARAWHVDAKKYSYGFFYHAPSDRIRLNTNAPLSVGQPLIKRFSSLIDYRYRDATIRRAGRIADSPPFWGGARITNVTHLRYCASGFTAQNSSGGRAMVTAGHCGEINDGFQNGSRTEVLGKLRGRAPYPQRDIAFITGGPFAPYIYGGDTGGVGRPVSGAGNPALGKGYCTSGSYSIERCGHTVVSMSGQFCADSETGCTNNLIVFSPRLGFFGDSGMPFYAYESDAYHVHIRGIYIAYDASYSYAEKYSYISAYGWNAVKTQ